MREIQPLNVIIIDDEESSHKHLLPLLAKHAPAVNVLASGRNVAEGVELIRKLNPDLIFLDIEMPDGTGFDLLKQFEDYNFKVIFNTGHNEYALTAIKFGAFDYFLKPVEEAELSTTIQKALKERAINPSKEQIKILWETLGNYKQKKLPTRIAIATVEGIHYKEVADIIRLEAKQNYTLFSLNNEDKQIIASVNLGEYVDQFEHYDDFMKVHRSHLINLNFVDKYVKAEGGYLVMKDGTQVSVSRLFKEELLDRLSKL